MPTLHLNQSTLEADNYRVEISLTGERPPAQKATAQFAFQLTTQEREDLRWYFEDFLEHPLDPAPRIAARIERDMQAIGTRLFQAVFRANRDTGKIWDKIVDELDTVRVEIEADVAGATALPWELLFEPDTSGYLALQTYTFVHSHPIPARTPKIPPAAAGRIRILLVICRPGGRDDVPFRSVAMRLIKGLSEPARQSFQLDVLRPPTFERLGEVLRQAKGQGQPYHVVHFDGHGAFLDTARLFETQPDDETMAQLAEWVNLDPYRFSPEVIYPRPRRPGSRGYLVFENPASASNLRLVDGPELGALLVETGVPALVLNACRSAHADPAPAEPVPAPPNPQTPTPDPLSVHSQVRALGSLAQEVMDAGVTGVVAMRYNVYVVTAAEFVAKLYQALVQGYELGQAGTLGRKQLHAQPLRAIAYEPRPLQDWPVPVIYEAAPLALFPQALTAEPLQLHLAAGEAAPERGALDPRLPPSPDAGFFGRDETLLALDRAFDTQPIVLLHAYAGSGKTTTAAEFARWYALTGGLAGPVLFSSFERYKTLAQALNDEFGRMFGGTLEQAGVNWPAKSEAERRDIALQVLQQIPVLWIWDNVEPIAGFPVGTSSVWNAGEQQELADFLRAARQTQAKFLLTSRRDERGWLGDLPARISVPPMPMPERVQLARALAGKHSRRLADVEDWRPLLRFTQGNPMTVTVLVGQALRDGLKTKEQIEAFVAKLRAGEAAFEDEVSEGRSKSLGASLSYGFVYAFSEAERKQLALLHFFQGFVSEGVLRMMGGLEFDWSLPEVRDLTRETAIALLDRAAGIGLLTAHGDGLYTIHPALPWYFKSLFDQYYPTLTPNPSPSEGEGSVSPLPQGEGPGVRATRAFVESLGELGNYYAAQYESGNRDVIAALAAEEANLLHARHLARQHGWWRRVISTMQGLRQLYVQTGRRAEWRWLVEEIVPDFVVPATDGPLLGREEQWGLVTEYRVRLAREARQWAEAERLQRVRVEWERQGAAPALALLPGPVDGAQRNAVRSLAASLHELGQIQRELKQQECVTAYEEAADLLQRISDQPGAAVAAFNLGHAYKNLPALRDLDQAEHWYQRSLDLYDERDRTGRGGCLGQLGLVAYERFNEARATKQPKADLLHHLNAALHYYHQALDLLPPNAVNDLAVTHNQLGLIYGDVGDIDRALIHYRECIRYDEAAGNLYGAAQTRYNVALALADAGRLTDAREYALAALRNYETYGERAPVEIEQTQRLIAWIEEKMRG